MQWNLKQYHLYYLLSEGVKESHIIIVALDDVEYKL